MTLELLVTSVFNTNNPSKKGKKKMAPSPELCTAISSLWHPSPCPVSLPSPPGSLLQLPLLTATASRKVPEGQWQAHAFSSFSGCWGQDSHPGHLLHHLASSSPAFTSLRHLFMASALGSSSCRQGSGFWEQHPHLQGPLLSLMNTLGGCLEVY